MNASAAIADPLLRRAFGRRARPSDPHRTARVRIGSSRLRAPVSRRGSAISRRTVMNNAGLPVDQVFLDANVLFSAAYRMDTPLRKLFTLPKVMLVTSAYALEEAKRNLASGQQRAELERLCKSVEVVSVLPPQGESPDLAKLPENDRPILWAAITVRATHLLSGDFKAFGRFYGQTIQGVAIMPPAEYLKGHRG